MLAQDKHSAAGPTQTINESSGTRRVTYDAGLPCSSSATLVNIKEVQVWFSFRDIRLEVPKSQ